MNLMIRTISEEYLSMINSFSCIESNEILIRFSAKVRRRIIEHSREMEQFLKSEALSEQENGLNTTHLFIDKDNNKIVAYVSMCNDSIGLEFNEREELELRYTTIPAVKIARLAVATEYQGCGMGKYLIQFTAYLGERIREFSGLTFVTLDCYEHRVSFYEKLGFVKNQIQPITLPYDTPISMRLILDDYLEKMTYD